MNSAYSDSSAPISARSCFWTARSSPVSICRTDPAGVDRCEMLKRLAQHLEQDGGRPAEHQDTLHRGDLPGQPPRLHWRNVAVTERGVIDEGEIQQAAAGRRRTDDRIGQRPDENLERV